MSTNEINAEDDLKTTILNLSKQIQEFKQERLSTSFQHHRFNSNPDALGLENDRRVITATHKAQNA